MPSRGNRRADPCVTSQLVSIVPRARTETKQAAEILAEGDREAATIVEQARNTILGQKAALIRDGGDAAKAVLFCKQKLPALFEA
jgi:hypothetical protein